MLEPLGLMTANLEFDPVGLHPSADDVEIVIGRGLFRPGIGCQDEIRGLASRDKLDEHCGGINPDAVSEHHWWARKIEEVAGSDCGLGAGRSGDHDSGPLAVPQSYSGRSATIGPSQSHMIHWQRSLRATWRAERISRGTLAASVMLTSSQTYMNQPHSPLANQAQGHSGIQSAAVPGDMWAVLSASIIANSCAATAGLVVGVTAQPPWSRAHSLRCA